MDVTIVFLYDILIILVFAYHIFRIMFFSRFRSFVHTNIFSLVGGCFLHLIAFLVGKAALYFSPEVDALYSFPRFFITKRISFAIRNFAFCFSGGEAKAPTVAHLPGEYIFVVVATGFLLVLVFRMFLV